MQCPVCKISSCAPEELEEKLTASACDRCGGHWIAHENYKRWLVHHGETLPEKDVAELRFEVEDVREAKLCPDCNRILLKYKVGRGLDFFVDHCSSCGGIWLDKNEWNALQEKNLHDEIHKIFSASWQSRAREESRVSKLDQVYESRFGTESYQKAKEIRAWLQGHPKRRELLAFLMDEDPYKI